MYRLEKVQSWYIKVVTSLSQKPGLRQIVSSCYYYGGYGFEVQEFSVQIIVIVVLSFFRSSRALQNPNIDPLMHVGK